MFGLLKNKISSFITAVTGAAKDEKAAPTQEQAPAAAQPEPEARVAIEQPPAAAPTIAITPQPPADKNMLKPAEFTVTETKHVTHATEEKKPEHHAQPQHVAEPKKIEKLPKPEAEHKHGAGAKPAIETPTRTAPTTPAQPTVIPKPVANPNKEAPKTIAQPEGPQRDIAPKIGIFSRVKSIFTNEVIIGPAEAEPLFEQLEMALLESDVSFDTTQQLTASMRTKIIGMRTSRSGMENTVRGAIKESFLELFASEPFDLFNFIAAKKAKGAPAVILMVGPNGAGKTTTIAKLAYQLQQRGFTSIIAAGDTFRKAAIEQAVLHGDKIGVRVVKHDYGADPTAVAFDAISAAKAGKIDAVLIDTAGRQETNLNLVKEMQKMQRVLSPDLKIFVGEAISGNALIEQIKSFHEAIGLDGVILTKLDCDAKGGGAFSIAHETKLPILMVGVGQEYADLKPFDADWIVDNVFAA